MQQRELHGSFSVRRGRARIKEECTFIDLPVRSIPCRETRI